MQEKIQRITATTVIVGIDIAKEVHWARITDYRGVDLMKPCKVHNSMEGFENLLAKVESVCIKQACDQVIIAMEPSGHYWKAMGWYLKLHESKPILVGVNPYHVKQSKELDDNSQTKSDRKDALVIAHLARDGRYFDLHLPEGEYAELRQLNAERKRLMSQISRANNTLIAQLDEYFPEYGQIWSNITCQTSLNLLKKTAFPADIESKSNEQLLEEIREASNRTEGNKLMQELRQAAKNSVGVKEGQKSVRIRILNLIEELEYFEKKKIAVESELEKVMSTLELGDVLQSMKGIGPVISSAFLGEVGNVNRFDSWKQVRSLAGLNLIENSSGKHKGKTKISKRGRPYLRHMLYIAGEIGIRHNSEMRLYYQYLRLRKKNPLCGNQAVVATGLKIMRILFHLAKTGEYYNPDKALGEVRLQQIEALANLL